jgi:hypothetical protein
MAIHIRNITTHILNNFLSLSPIGWFLYSSFPIGQHLHFSLRIRIAEITQTSSFTIHIMKVLGQSPIHVHDVRANLPFTIHIMKVPSSLLSTFMKKLSGLCHHHECGMLK